MEVVLKVLETILDISIQLWPITLLVVSMVGLLIWTRNKKEKKK